MWSSSGACVYRVVFFIDYNVIGYAYSATRPFKGLIDLGLENILGHP